MPNATLTRRTFLALVPGVLASLGFGRGPLAALEPEASVPGPAGHPDPRPGIDGSRVLAPDGVAPHVAELFGQVRQIAPVVDGIRCHCGCADVDGMYSLLSCYEGMGMAQYCEICEGEGRLVVQLHGDGRGLDEIRAAVDRRFG